VNEVFVRISTAKYCVGLLHKFMNGFYWLRCLRCPLTYLLTYLTVVLSLSVMVNCSPRTGYFVLSR